MAGAWLSVFGADFKRVSRDRFILLILFYLPVLSAVARWGIPALQQKLGDTFDITPYYPLIGAMLALTLPFMMGVILGMQLLEEKDAHTLSAIAVTPYSVARYYFFRLAIYAALGMVMLVATHQILGLVSGIPLWKLVVIAATLSLNTGLSSVIPPILARNQVQGFAVMKASGALFVGPVFSYFVPRHWDLFFGVIPFYWPIKAYFLAVSGGSMPLFWTAIVAGTVTQLAVFLVLYRVFMRRILR